MSQPSPNRPRDLANVAIRRADQGLPSQTTRQNFYISPNRAAPLKRIPSPLQSSFTTRDPSPSPSDPDALRSANSASSIPNSPFAPAPLNIPNSPANSSPTDSKPPSPHRVKGSSGDKAFDSIKAIATRHALLERSREEARARDGGIRRQHPKGPPGSVPASQTQMSDPLPSPQSQPMASTPIAVRIDTNGPRSAALDSGGTLAGSPSSAFQTQLPMEDPDAVDIPALIAAAGSPEAAIRKLLREKHTAAQNNAQLWRLLNKQKTMVMDLNKDLQKAVKDKDRYRRKLKEQLLSSASGFSLPGSATGNSLQFDRDGSKSPSLVTSLDEIPTPGSRIASLASERTIEDYLSNTSQSSGGLPPPSPNSAIISPLYATPMPAPFAAQSESRGSDRSGDSSSHLTPAVPEHRLPTGSPAALLESNPSGTTTLSRKGDQSREERNALLDATETLGQRSKQGSFSAAVRGRNNSIAARKGPPAPLDLSPQKATPAVDGSRSNSSELGTGSSSEKQSRQDGTSERQESETSKHAEPATDAVQNRPALERDESTTNLSVTSSPGGYSSMDEFGSPQIAQVQTYQSLNALNAVVKTPHVAEYSSDVQRSLAQHSVSSPGLPVSPRPTDRPANAPPPRPSRSPNLATPASSKETTHALFPRSQKAAQSGLETPTSATAPPMMRAGSSQHSITRSAEESDNASMSDLVSPGNFSTPESSVTVSGPPLTPGDIFKGFMTDQWPGLLLPPTALTSIYVKVDSSRLRPSRHSYIVNPRQPEENPVFSLAIYDRADNTQLWRIEKTLMALAQLDSDLKSVSKFRMKLPDRNLFIGHAPARIDARRSALAAYFGYMLETNFEEKASSIICAFLSNDAIGAEATDYFQSAHSGSGSVDTPISTQPKPRKDGYLTKKGKNFGGWKARYFVLDGPSLRYFEAPGGALLGAIKLQYASIGRQTGGAQENVDEENQYRHAFLIMEPKRRDKQSHIQHVLCAESDEERDAWVRCLMQYIEDDENERPKTATKSGERSLAPNSSPRSHKSMGDMRRADSQHSGPPPELINKLRAVRYDSTVAAEAPVIGPSTSSSLAPPPPPPTFITEDTSEKPPASHPVISGPKNGVVIQDASTWGNKREHNLLTKDRSKRLEPADKDKNAPRERKRSIFAFTGRASTESNSRDSMVASQASDSPQHRPVFGMPLAEVIEYASPTDVPVQLPAVVYRCLEYLRGMDAALEEGIFRMSGSNVVVKALRERFNTEGDVRLLAPGAQTYDIHAVASLLKLYLRELPATILTRDLHLDFVRCLELDERTKIEAFNILVNRLPPANRELLDKLTGFLREIVDNENVNKMNVRNVGIVFSPTLNIPGPLITIFVTDHRIIFGPPVDIATVDSRLPELLSNSRENSRPRVPSIPALSADGMQSPQRQESTSVPDMSSDNSLMQNLSGVDWATTQRMAKEAYDIGYTAPPSATQARAAPPARTTSQQPQAPLRNPELEQIQLEEEASSPLNQSQPHTSFHSMHFPDPPMTARFPPSQHYSSQHSSPRSPSTMSSNSASSTSTLTNGLRESPGSSGTTTVFNKKASLINLNDINISFSPLMGGSSPEFSRGGFGPHNSFAPSNLMTSMSAGQIASPTTPVTPSIGTSQSGPVGGSSIPSTKYSELASAAATSTPRSGSVQSASSTGSGGESSGGGSFGRRLLRRQSGAFLVRAGLIDDKSRQPRTPGADTNGSASRGFMPGGLGLTSPSVGTSGQSVETPRSASFGRKE